MRVALTGGATGIGAALVQKLNDAGHQVIVFDLVQPASSATSWIKTDLDDPASIEQAVYAVDGPFDAMINNAGLPPRQNL